MSDYIRLIRPHQFIKNLLIFFPLFFAMRIDEWHLLVQCAIAFVAFSLLAGAVYIFNDYQDREEDRLHPEKKHRPIASGHVSARKAGILMAVLLFLAFAASALLIPAALPYFVFYLLLNVLYSIRLKHIPIVDVSIVAIGFVIRLLISSAITAIELSKWLILMIFLGALFIALAKRRDDVALFDETGKRSRKVIDGYNLEFLNAAMIIMATILIVAYIMYTVSPAVIERVGSDNLYMTSFFAIVGIMRYLQITMVERNSGNPTRLFLRDSFLQLTIAIWLLCFILILY